jgi:peptide/nickel transport system permease protein
MHEEKRNAAALEEPEDSLRKQSQFKQVMGRLCKNKLAVLGMIIFALYIIIAIIGPLLTPYNYAAFDQANKNQGPSMAHLLGTDQYGRDMLTRLLYGTRFSLGLGLGAVCIGLVFGIIIGCLAGYFGGWVENLIMRICDVFQAIPGMLLAVIISMVLGTGFVETIIALGFGRIALNCRLIRAQFLSQRKLEYVEAAQATNCSKIKLMFVHILPNTISPLIVSSTMGVGGTIMMAANLSFINLGVLEPTPEWGAMISSARNVMRYYPYQVLFPGLFMAIFVLSLNLFGDGLRDALDPKLKN